MPLDFNTFGNPQDQEDVDVSNGTITLASAIPDSGMFQNPIYQWWGEEIDAADGTSPVDWPEGLAGLPDASAVGDPTKQTQSGFEAVLYGGGGDGHNFSPDSQLPTGDEAFSFFALVYQPTSLSADVIIGYGNNSNTAGLADLSFRNTGGGDQIAVTRSQDGFYSGGSPPTGEWVSVGGAYDGNGGLDVGYNGTFNKSHSVGSFSLQDQDHGIGYARNGDTNYLNAYLAEVIVCAAGESGTAFSNYHQNRLG